MKQTILSIVAMVILVTMAFAQKIENEQIPSHPHRFQHRHQQDFARALQFTDEQKEQMKSISKEFYHKMADLSKNEDISVKELRDQRADLVKAYRASFQNLLTPDQKERWIELKKKNEEKKKMMAGKRLEKMKTRLNLSDEQTAKIQNLDEQYRDQLRRFKEGDLNSRVDRKEEIQTLRKLHKEELRAILSPEQQKMLDDRKKDRMGRF